MNDDSWLETASPPVRRRRRRWMGRLILIASPVLALAGAWVYLVFSAERKLREAIAEVDHLDPGWRLEELEARRAVLPDERNGALAALAARRLLPERWPAWDHPQRGESEADKSQREELQEGFHELEPPRRLRPGQLAALRAELVRAAPALARARALADLPEGRYALTYAPDFVGTLLPHIQEARQVASLLAYDALGRAEAGDADGALASCRAVVNTGRSIGDEPFTVSQLVRIACRLTALKSMERVLSQGEPSAAALLTLQQLLEREESEPLLLIAARGERAGSDRFLEHLQTGESRYSLHDLDKLSGSGGLTGSGPDLVETLTLMGPSSMDVQRAAVLRYTTQLVEAVKLSPLPMQSRLKELHATLSHQPVLVRLLAPAMQKMTDSYLSTQVELRCAIAALAAERFRRETGRWPETLDALKEAGYLREVPDDLFDGQPLRFRRGDRGVTVYSVGPDGKDDGGKLDRKQRHAPGTDVGFRLWDVGQRRQSAPD